MTHEYPLTAWIGSCMAHETLRGVLDGITRGQPITQYMATDGDQYTAHVLKEEVTKQFSHRYRPIIEAILNSVDASRHAGQQGEVRVEATPLRVRVIDNGAGMDLVEILRFLIIPFGTQKDKDESGNYIGQFGLGFFSTLKYCLEQPNQASVTVLTTKGATTFEARFYATSDEAAGLRLSLRKRRTKKEGGTSVTIEAGFNPAQLEGYVRSELRGVSSAFAQIYYEGKAVNEEGGRWYTAPASLVDHEGRTMEQRVMLQRIDHARVNLTSVGVIVKSFEASIRGGINVLFPRLATVVIGRDEFKHDANYDHCVDAAFVAFQSMIEAAPVDAGRRKDFVELAGSLLSALGRDGLAAVPNFDGIAACLVPGKRYVFLDRDFERWSSFADTRLAFPASPQASAIWSRKYGSHDDFLREHVRTVKVGPVVDFERVAESELAAYPNVAIIFESNPVEFQVETIALVEHEPLRPFLHDQDRKTLYVNVFHEYFRGPKDSLKKNMAFVAYLNAMGLASKGYREIEQRMLLASGRMMV